MKELDKEEEKWMMKMMMLMEERGLKEERERDWRGCHLRSG